MTTYFTIRTTGRIKAVGVEFYLNSECTNLANSVDWGLLSPGSTYGVQLWAKNIKNTAIMLNLTSSNWMPIEAEGYMALSWDYTGAVLHPGQVQPVKILLDVSQWVTGFEQFSFDIDVVVTEV